MTFLSFLSQRLSEASTYAGLAVLLALLHVNVDPGLLHSASIWGGALAAGLAVVVAEKGRPTAEIAADVMAAMTAALPAKNPAAAARAAGALALLLAVCACANGPGPVMDQRLAAARAFIGTPSPTPSFTNGTGLTGALERIERSYPGAIAPADMAVMKASLRTARDVLDVAAAAGDPMRALGGAAALAGDVAGILSVVPGVPSEIRDAARKAADFFNLAQLLLPAPGVTPIVATPAVLAPAAAPATGPPIGSPLRGAW